MSKRVSEWASVFRMCVCARGRGKERETLYIPSIDGFDTKSFFRLLNFKNKFSNESKLQSSTILINLSVALFCWNAIIYCVNEWLTKNWSFSISPFYIHCSFGQCIHKRDVYFTWRNTTIDFVRNLLQLQRQQPNFSSIQWFFSHIRIE